MKRRLSRIFRIRWSRCSSPRAMPKRPRPTSSTARSAAAPAKRRRGLMHILEDITFKDASESDVKRENANIDGDTAMGTMLKYGSESAKQFYDMYVLNPEHARAHREGDIHIHDLDFLTLTTTCTPDRPDASCSRAASPRVTACCASRRTSAAIPRWRASPSRATRTISTAVRPSPALITTWPPAWRRPICKEYRRALGAALELLLNHDAANDEAKAIVRQIRAETGAAPTLKPNKEFDDAAARSVCWR